MSRATKRKHVINELQQSDSFDPPKIDQKVVQILESRGNNLHLVRDSNRETFLVSMPTKFRRNIWVKRGDLVLVDDIEEGDKVRGEICRIFTKDSVKSLIRRGYWIVDENTEDNHQLVEPIDDFVNPNRPPVFDESSSDSDDD